MHYGNKFEMMWLGDGAGYLSVLGCPTYLDNSRERAYCACSRCIWGLFGHIFSSLSYPFSFSLSL